MRLYSGKVVLLVVLAQNLFYSGKRGCIRANCCIRVKVVVFSQSGCIRANLVVFLQSGCIRKSGCIRAKLVEFGLKWLYIWV